MAGRHVLTLYFCFAGKQDKTISEDVAADERRAVVGRLMARKLNPQKQHFGRVWLDGVFEGVL